VGSFSFGYGRSTSQGPGLELRIDTCSLLCIGALRRVVAESLSGRAIMPM
jgi:hypothetical protein